MRTNSLLRMTRLSPALVLALAGLAHADGDARRVPAAPESAGPRAEGVMVLARTDEEATSHVWSDGKNEIRIERKGGKVAVSFNGDEVMTIDDEDLFQSEIAGARDHARAAEEWARRFHERVERGFAPPAPPSAPMYLGERPKVMIGVTMESAENADVDLPEGIDDASATSITRVVKDLPADKAGLKEGDVIIRVNGSGAASPDDIRAAIKGKDAGDELKFVVIREGKEHVITIGLAAYDAEKLGSPRAWGLGTWSTEDAPDRLSPDDMKKMEVLRAEMAKASAEMEKVGAELAKASTDDERERLGDELADLGSRMADLGAQMGGLSGDGLQWRFFGPGQGELNMQRLPRLRLQRAPGTPPKAFVFTPEPGQASEPTGDDRVDELNKRLDKLEKMLEKLTEEKPNKN